VTAPSDPFEVVLLDLDGTVYIGHLPVPGSPEAIAALRARGQRVAFLTNDPAAGRGEFAARLATIGVPATPDDVVTTGMALALLLRQEGFEGATALILGTPAFRTEVMAAGLLDADATGADPKSVDLVVVGGSVDLGHAELTRATRALRAGARLFGAGRDATYPTPSGPAPASGPYLAPVEVAGGVPATVAGKPERPIFDAARTLLGATDGTPICMVGDRLDSDILGAHRAGLTAILVLSGTTTPTDAATAPITPDLICHNLAEFTGVTDRGD